LASVKTVKGREKMAKAHAGLATLPKITHIALGSGGVNGTTPKGLTGNENSLFNEKIRKEIELIEVNSTTYRYVISVDADTDSLNGVNINEAGLFDEDGDLIAIKTFTNKGLESGVTIQFEYEVEY